jgi:AraC-like DNA-binding protein
VLEVDDEPKNWIEQLLPGQFRHLFDHLPGTFFFAKDLDGRLTAANPALVRQLGFKEERDALGVTDEQVYPPRLAQKYRRDDAQVFATGKPLLGLIELWPNSQGRPDWFITDKIPLFNRDGEVCGLCGTIRSHEEQRSSMQPYLELSPAAEHLKANFRDKLDVATLARISHMSVRQFERKFRATFQMTPRDFMLRMRVIEACRLLVETRLPVTTVALEAGFYDHSDFARQFRRHMGQSASQYREERQNASAAVTLPPVASL